MATIITDIYFGKAVYEQITMSKEYYLLLDKINKATEILQQNLLVKDRQSLIDLIDLCSALSTENCICHFEEGFKIGLNIALCR